jgi:uncharacterized membrane protein
MIIDGSSLNLGVTDMKNPLENLHYALGLGLILAVIVFLIRGQYTLLGDLTFWAFILRYIHVFFGILWIGLLYYFNFVQIPSMPKIPDEQKPAIGKVIAPTALYFFRWAAAGTVLFGLITAGLSGYLSLALTFQAPATTIGIGMWLALIMAANVWFVIWPNQKKVLGIVNADADAKKKAGRIAMLASRTNTMLSIPMLYCMVGQKLL